MNDTVQPGPDPGDDPTSAAPRLVRPLEGRVLAGVAAGIARYLRLDPLLVRVVLLALVFTGGLGVALYVAGWLLIPDEGEVETRAMAGLRRLGDGGLARRLGLRH